MFMKAKAPEKIYVALDEIDDLVLDHRFDYPICIEYIRTDAFIGKVCSGIEKLLSGYIIRNFHFGDSYDIDRFIEDLKNYIKVE